MKIAIIADIHSNLEALEAVLKEIEKLKIKKIYCAGDIVGYGANPNECINLIKEYNISSCQGNHDLCSVNFYGYDWFNEYGQRGVEFTNKILIKENKRFLLKLNPIVKENSVFIVHGSPESPLYEYIYPYTLDSYFKNFFEKNKGIKILIMGHTHIPFIKKFWEKLAINPGSVGQPRDKNPKASFCILDDKRAKIIRIEYDINKAADKILKAKLPSFLAERLFVGV